jgi:hypothetical protein
MSTHFAAVRRDIQLGKERGARDAERAKAAADRRAGNGRSSAQPGATVLRTDS